MPVRLSATVRDQLARASHPLVGGWLCTGSPVVAEIMAAAGLDWLFIDMEHGPNGLGSVLAQLQALAAYPATAVVRVPIGESTILKQVLDLGAQNLLVPMVSSADQAAELVRAVRYPPRGSRGVGAGVARSARWGRVGDYLGRADDLVSLMVQIESAQGVDQAGAIAATDGIDAVLLGPADLAAGLGHLGQETHPEVVQAIGQVMAQCHRAGTPVGVNAFDPVAAQRYVDLGADFVLVAADVQLLVGAVDQVAAHWAAPHRTEQEDPDEPR
jgi:4-hydroxy-2-oxoheptanedioate aldolase